MKRTSLILLAAAIIIGTIASSSYALDKGIGEEFSSVNSTATVAALYAPHFNYFFFTSRYMNDYYVVRQLIHYFFDEYQEDVVSSLPQVITQKNTTNLSPANFVSQHEEEIAIELAQIIIRKNLASFALQGV